MMKETPTEFLARAYFEAGLVWGAAIVAMAEAIRQRQPKPWLESLKARAKELRKPVRRT